MKRLIIIISLLLLAFPTGALADGSVIQGEILNVGEDRLNSNPLRTITFTCTGDSVDGSVPDTIMTIRNFEKVKGWCFRGVETYPISGGTAPDAASIFVFDDGDMDLLGSEDGTTPYAGLNLIHATLKRACFGNLYLPRAGLHTNYFTPVKGLLTLKVIDQATASADYAIVLIFSR